MRFKFTPAPVVCALFALVALTAGDLAGGLAGDVGRARAQDGQDDRQVIDDFVTTRGITFESPGAKRPAPQTSQRPAQQSASRPAQPASQSAPRPAGKSGSTTTAKNTAGAPKKGGGSAAKNQTAAKGQGHGSGTGHGTGSGAGDAGSASVVNASASGSSKKPIGLGFTLFIKQGDNLVAADPSREFRQGDRLRIALETNTDGYLYIFHTESGRNPQMIFPNPAVDAGRNFVGAHARDFYPTDLSAWFEFDEVPATERLYFVVARQPLAGVPTGRDLIGACGGADADCLWKPTPAQWERIMAGAQGRRTLEGRNAQLARLQAPPPGSMTRGIKVKRDEPAPALVRVNDSADADLFVTTIDLIHK
jgi:hypothetical protein